LAQKRILFTSGTYFEKKRKTVPREELGKKATRQGTVEKQLKPERLRRLLPTKEKTRSSF